MPQNLDRGNTRVSLRIPAVDKALLVRTVFDQEERVRLSERGSLRVLYLWQHIAKIFEIECQRMAICTDDWEGCGTGGLMS
jgi:hypothetical protein